MRMIVLFLAGVLLVLALILGGTAPFGRVALALGLNKTAVMLLSDPSWRGVAQYRAGQFEQAVASFRQAGPEQMFNLGNALTRNEEYAAALESYDRAMILREDAQAQANFDLVLAFYAGTEIDADSIIKWSDQKDGASADSGIAQGAARAASTGDGVTNSGALLGLPELTSRGRLSVRKVFDDKYVTASPRWLATLPDVPGAFLAARILHEHKRRAKAGEGQPRADTPW
ncbi:hypothetical protein [Actibacterium lipolyticum]|uniref:Tetratricopeptide repeat protein n=1 Tax=Actibacterium lipolyticum TaxID=1524263 RepID=A0A238KPX8_9RHOB|nr:hypothetical protein [Actibacterium lipolyticum]SMX44914.1 Tetratricopeptide repeat protein [Actibacterium lipolyticum]